MEKIIKPIFSQISGSSQKRKNQQKYLCFLRIYFCKNIQKYEELRNFQPFKVLALLLCPYHLPFEIHPILLLF
jgi:hypothetical protein